MKGYLLRNRIAALRDQQTETEPATDLERLTQLGWHICKYKINLVSEKHFPFIIINKNEKKKPLTIAFYSFFPHNILILMISHVN